MTEFNEDVDYKRYDPGWSAPPFDSRFPHQNQTKNCLQNYVDFHRCRKIKGEDYQNCNYFKKVYMNVCPFSWVERFNDQMDNGTFPHKF